MSRLIVLFSFVNVLEASVPAGFTLESLVQSRMQYLEAVHSNMEADLDFQRRAIGILSLMRDASCDGTEAPIAYRDLSAPELDALAIFELWMRRGVSEHSAVHQIRVKLTPERLCGVVAGFLARMIDREIGSLSDLLMLEEVSEKYQAHLAGEPNALSDALLVALVDMEFARIRSDKMNDRQMLISPGLVLRVQERALVTDHN